MKRNFGLKAFVFSMIVLMGLTLVPSLYAVSRYTNADGVTAENAEAVFTYRVETEEGTDLTDLEAGDIVTVTISMDKSPTYGVYTFGARIVYDDTQLELTGLRTITGGSLSSTQTVYLAGQLIGMSDEVGKVTATDGNSYVAIAAFTSSTQAKVVTTGDLISIDFEVLDSAAGDITLYPLSADDEDNGFSITQHGEDGKETSLVYYINDNIPTNMCVNVPMTGLTVSTNSVVLDKTNNPTETITVETVPDNATDGGEITYSSADETVATVNSNGVITAVGNGETTVTVSCTTTGGTTYTKEVAVTVSTSISSLSFASSSYTVDLDETKDLSAELTINPSDSSYSVSDATWTSSNTSVATVDANGVVTGVANGTTTITVTLGGVTKTVTVKVAVSLKSISLSTDTVEVYKGDDVTVTVTPQPDGATFDSLETSFNSGSNYATASANATTGVVTITGVAEGESKVAVSANKNMDGDDMYKIIVVTVKENKILSATITTEEQTEDFLRGETLELAGEYTTEEDEETVHATTDDNTYYWTSSDESVATVDSNGVVTAVSEGTATITLTIAGYTDTYEITVTENHVTGIVISDEDLATLEAIDELTVGDVVTIPFTLLPDDVTITDTVDEILAMIGVEYDEELVDVTVEYDEETGEGTITITVKAAGEATVTIGVGEEDDEDATIYTFTFTCVEETVDTSDMPVIALTVIMAISVMGLVKSKKVFNN